MEQGYALCARRCRTQTALDKLTKRRQRLQRCKTLGERLTQRLSPTRENALVFLDDQWLPSTSNAVARGNRRYRKRPKSLYSVQTPAWLADRSYHASSIGCERMGESHKKVCSSMLFP